MRELISTIHRVHSWFIRAVNLLQSPLLLAIRLYWGYQFMQDGWGKLTHLDKVTQFFASLNLPMPGTTALMVGSIELVGGFLFTFGIFSRLTSVVLFVNMTMAYLSVPDDRTNFLHIFSNPSDFYGASPYTYWFAALLILIFGPGLFAVDSILGYFAKRKPARLADERTPPLIHTR
jgi:putative oxidoreductase